MKVNLLIVDDHAVLREGLQALLERHPDICVVGQAANGYTALELVRQLRPNMVLMDLSMPGMNGIEATRLILQEDPHIAVIILSMWNTTQYVRAALQTGVKGYLLKESAAKELIEAVLAVAAGHCYFSQPVTDMLGSDYAEARSQPGDYHLLENLSVREQEVMYLVLEGKSSTEIGKMLHLSPKTVDSYRSRLMQKLGVSDLVGLVRFAFVHGLISTC